MTTCREPRPPGATTLIHATSTAAAIAGLYAITPSDIHTDVLITSCDKLFQGGVRLLQYRRKAISPALARHEAGALQTLAAAHGAALIINDDLALAISIGASGVHWGREDLARGTPLSAQINAARQRAAVAGCPPGFVVGISCYNDFDLAQHADFAGADYIAFGSMFASSTKPQAANAPISLIARAKQTFGTPVVAIGGITRDNAQRLLDAGVDALAVISDLFDADNDTERVARAKRFLEMFDRRTASGHHPGHLNP